MASNATQRLESISRHLTPGHEKSQRPKFELEDHPVDAVRSLKVRKGPEDKYIMADQGV